MTLARLALATFAALAFAAPAVADDSGNFLVRLGNDTTSVERYTRTASRIVVDQVGRSPRVLRRHFTYDYANGTISKFTMVVTPPGSTTPTQTIDATFGPDSMRAKIVNGTTPAPDLVVAMGPGTLVITGSSPWSEYESQIAKLVKSKRDSVGMPLYYVGATSTNRITISKLGRDSVAIVSDRGDVFHVRVDKEGRILGVLPIAGTAKFGVERLAALDLDAMAAAFMVREQAGGGLGVLSPRDTVNATTAGATLWIDYSRPSKRGRAVFGGIVPYGEVWRTGANAATQFKTDKALDFNGTVVPAGFYTLWTLPTASGWKLIVNSETGQWGTAHKADKDLVSVPMQVSALPQSVEHFTIGVEASAQGGVINLDWDTTRASAAFTVKP